jgi:uncharacterized protein
MTQAEIIENTKNFVKQTLQNAEGGHDWFHIQRVLNNAQHIAKNENVDNFIITLGALLHDIADSKFHNGNETIGPDKARMFLKEQGVTAQIIEHVVRIIENISFKGGNEEQKFRSPELDVIQDADRLDALGAIGIARTFNYGGFKGRALYDPEIKPDLNMSKAVYKSSSAPTINHFYEKLLLLKDRMNTQTGRQMAADRHKFMEEYLEHFYKECDGEL